MRIGLQHPYPSVKNESRVSFGGNQAWFEKRYLQKSGCGVVACTDLLMYLCRQRQYHCLELFPGAAADAKPITRNAYLYSARLLHKRYLPVIPYFGINGWNFVWGLNRCFRKNEMNLKASFGVRRKKLWSTVEQMLREDVPVILSVGPNFPFLWKKEKLTFYTRGKTGAYTPACMVSGHYVTVTAMDGIWLCISSWGREYYINREEYWIYARKHSGFLVSNLVYIREKKRILDSEK